MKKPTILCVDDERNVLFTLRTQLSRHFPGYRIEIAESGEEALDLVKDLLAAGDKVPLVIADQIMPGMKGDELLIELHTRHPEILKVMLTGQARAEDIGNVINRGSLYRFIAKPWNEADLILTVTEALRRYQQDWQLAQQQAALERANRDLEALNADLEQQVRDRTQQLRHQESKLKETQRLARLGGWELNLQSGEEYWSEEIYTIHELPIGCDRPSCLEDPEYYTNFYAPEARPQVWAAFHKAITYGEAYDLELPFITAQGNHRWVKTYGRPVLENGVVVRITGVLGDITERKQAETLLRKSEESLKIAQRIARIGNWEFDLATQAVSWSDELFPIYGQDATQWQPTYLEFKQQVHPEDWPAFELAIQQAIVEGISYEIEHRVIHPNGSMSYAFSKGEAVFNEQGQVIKLIGTTQDISEAKQAQEALRQSEEKFRQLAETIQEIFFIHDAESYELLYISPAFEQIIGIPEASIYGNPMLWQELAHPDDRDRIKAAFQQQLVGRACDQEYRMIKPDGDVRWLRIRAFPVCDPSGKICRITGIIEDITIRKQAELEAQKSNALLQAISTIQSQFIAGLDLRILFDGLLEDLLEITDSAYGFIGEILYTDQGKPYIEEAHLKVRGKPYLKTHAITNITWNEETRAFYAQHTCQGMEFHNLETLFGATITTGKPVIANNPASDPRRGGVPQGHPPLNAFLGLPFFSDNALLGMVGIANRPGGYDHQLVEYLQPLLTTCSHIIEGYRNYHRRQQAEVALQKLNQDLERRVEERTQELVQSQQILQESEQRFRQLAENIDQVFWLAPANRSQTMYVSPAFEKIWGHTCEELYCSPMLWLNVVHPDDRDRILLSLERTADGGHDHEYRIVRPDGEIRWIWDRAFPIRDESGQVYRIAGIAEDITERKQAEAAIRKANAELETRVEERTAQLKQAAEAAEAANRAKSEFLANVSHELRTPLNGILGYAQILRDSPHLNPKEQQGIEVIHRCGSHLLTLINDILDLAKIEAQKLELSPCEFHFPSFLQNLADICCLRATEKGIQFFYAVGPDLPSSICADEKRLRQILLNLLGNALKFTEQGSVTFKIELKQQDSKLKSQIVRFQIEDTGIGISPEQVERILLPFEQAGDPMHKAQGTGLGLAITRNLLKMMSSTLEITSQPGQGSIFGFEIELQIAYPAVQQIVSPSAKVKGFKGQPRQILIIDDQADNRLVFRNLLEPLGFTILEANNGQTGLEQAIESQPDLLIVDLIMPEMDGIQMLHHLRELPQGNTFKVIVSSARAFAEDRQQSLAAGADDFLAKPVQIAALLNLVQKHLNLEWCYETSGPEAKLASATQGNRESMVMVMPEKATLEELLDLALRGNIQKLLTQITELEQSDPGMEPFTTQLQIWIEGFQLKKIRDFLHRLNSQD